MGIEQNKKIALRFLQFVSEGDINSALELMAENLEYWVALKTEPVEKPETKTKGQFKKLLQITQTAFPGGLAITSTGMTAEGDRVAVEGESYGRTTSGKLYNNFYHFLFEIREGKIHAMHEYLDTSHTKEVLFDK